MGLTKPRAAQIFNLDYKQSTRVVTTTNITLSGGAPSLVDGVTLSLGDRVLVTGQSSGAQNGLYYVTTLGSGANGTWARTSDGNDNGEIEAGMIVMVTEGTIYADTQWKLITDDPITIGTTALTFTQNYMANSISGGTSNVVVNSNANVTISSAGTANVLTVSSTGIYITGLSSASGNIAGGNILTAGLVSATGNATAGNLLTAGVVSATANVTGGNLLTAGLISATSSITSAANVVGGNLTTAGLVTATGNITGGNIRTAGLISSTGNVTGGNILTAGVVSATGNVTANYFIGNGACLTGVVTSLANINNGNSNVTVIANSNVTVGIAGTSNVAVFATTGEYITGVLSASGNIIGGNLTTAGIVTATGNITSGNVLTGGLISATSSITSAANVVGGNITTAGLITATGNVTGGNILTSGLISATSTITSAANITGGNILTAGIMSSTGNGIHGNVLTSGLMSATGVVVSNGGYIRANSQLIVDSYSGSSEGGQISLAWTGVNGLTGQGNGTWNLDVDSSNTFRTFYQNTTGGTNVVFALNSTNQTANFSGNIGASYYYGNGAFLTGLSAGTSNGISNGATSISIPVSSGNIAMSVAGQANTVVINLGSFTMYGSFATPKTLNANVQVANAVNAVLFGPVSLGNAYNITVPDASTLYIYSGA